MTRPQPSAATVKSPTASHRAISLDDLFEVLSSEWRRRAVRALSTRSEATTAEEFVDTLHAEHGTTTDRSETRLAFHHNHLPRLAQYGIVEYDRETGLVGPGENLSEAASSLAAVAEDGSTPRVEH
ncbi:DUF7344 domain-containing protein [Halomarina oriensis]|uniref:DUF7344 domain-containing protein n=1 Tax=Halomarina oriensis TaxID=671145 RepID=A0A6B0GL97_9EURY|nr:hypothetical protein [Halomarina oriensis]MWG33563.1 hypothetical protein [Halomarina oriensis]